MFAPGQNYTRDNIYEALKLPESERGGDWLNGYHRHHDDYYVFCNIGVPGRTGYAHDTQWEGGTLVWFGKPQSHYGQQTIQRLASGNHRVFVFYRTDNRAAFTFAGEAKPIVHPDTKHPARIDWTFPSASSAPDPHLLPDETTTQTGTYTEGQRMKVYVNRYERDPSARAACIKHYGCVCDVCKFDFAAAYGKHGEGFIHVHHKRPLSEIGESYEPDPVNDLIPVCPNCHAMLHRGDELLTVDKLKELMLAVQNKGAK